MIRPARLEDAPRLSEINAAAWKVAYRGVLPDAAVDAREPHDRIDLWTEYLTTDNGELALVLEVDGVVVAYATYGPQRGADQSVGEVYGFYVSPDTWRGGLGTQTMTAAEEALRDLGYSDAVLWTLVANTGARAFYEKRGWQHHDVLRDQVQQGVRAVETQYRKQLR